MNPTHVQTPKIVLGTGQIGDRSGMRTYLHFLAVVMAVGASVSDQERTTALTKEISLPDPIAKYNTPEEAQAFLNVFRKHGHTDLDSARGYSPHAPGTTEPLLGQTDFHEWAVVDSNVEGPPDRDNVATSIQQSLDALKVKKVVFTLVF